MQLMILSATQYEAQMKNNSTYNRILYNTKNMILSKEVEMRNSRSVFNSSSMSNNFIFLYLVAYLNFID